ncbi:MAG: family 10 glycosylhydrolase [Armatimonadetes bacterium]|nr:family 10 glycosylhydrolase [Armatimonadota bacterium]
MERWSFLFLLVTLCLPTPSNGQVLVSGDGKASTENVERWLRRVRIPYERAPHLLNRRGNKRSSLVVVATVRLHPSLVARLRSFQKAVVVTEGEGVNNSKGNIIVLTPSQMGDSDGEQAERLASALLLGNSIPPSLQKRLRNRWSRWINLLRAKRVKWLREVSAKFFKDPQRKSQSLALLTQEIRIPALTGASNGTVWFQRLKTILDEQKRLYHGLATSLEPQQGEVRGVWIHTYRPTNWDEVCSFLKQKNFNAIFFRASRGGNAVYPSAFLPADQWVPSVGDELARACAAAQRYQMDLHAWRVHFHFGTAPEWYQREMEREGRLVRDPQGQTRLWLNPADPRNQEHELRAVLELTRYPIAGFHSDYIRYPETGSYDFTPVSRSEFEKVLGSPLATFPEPVLGGLLNIRYRDFQRSVITRLVRRVRDTVKSANPSLTYSAAVWTRHRYYYSVIYQDWVRWLDEGLLDFACPMNYTADNEILEDRWKEQLYDVMGKRPLVCGIGVYLMDDEFQVLEQIKLIRELGCDGFVLFSYNVPFIKDCVELLYLGPTAQPTYPCYRAPDIDIRLSDGVRVADKPILYKMGDSVLITLSVRPGVLEWREPTRMDLWVVWESPRSGATQVIGQKELHLSQNETTSFSVRSSILSGRWRVVVYGSLRKGNDPPVSFVVRGPFVQSVPPSQLEQTVLSLLADRDQQRGAIGVIERSWGGRQIASALGKMGHQVFLVRSLEPSFWQGARALVLPPIKDLREMTYERCRRLRQWVAEGGRLLLLSEACGERAHPNLFPEIAWVVGEGPLPRNHRLFATLSPTQRTWFLRPTGGRVIWNAANGAIAVEGRLGKGQVILCGLRIPDEKASEQWTDFPSVIRRLVIRLTGTGTAEK